MEDPTSEEVVKVFKVIGFAVGGLVALIGVLWWVLKNVIFRDELNEVKQQFKDQFDELRKDLDNIQNSQHIATQAATQAQLAKLMEKLQELFSASDRKQK